jgi:hypothetical protein
MKKLIAIVLAGVMVLSLGGGVALAKPEGIGDGIVDGQVLNGQHYNLNIIGVKNAKSANMDDNGGHVIFVDLNGKSKINLVESGTADAPGTTADEFAVLDKNGTGGSGAVLALPDPDLDPYVVGGDMEGVDTISAYSIFVRPLGKPDGWAKITTCADVLESNLADFLDADAVKVLNKAADLGGVASIESTGQLLREKGKSIFTNQTAALLTIVLKVEVDYEDDGTVDETLYVRVPIFDDMLANEYWEYDNHGLKLLQVRIYRVGTDVSTADDPTAWDTLPLP